MDESTDYRYYIYIYDSVCVCVWNRELRPGRVSFAGSAFHILFHHTRTFRVFRTGPEMKIRCEKPSFGRLRKLTMSETYRTARCASDPTVSFYVMLRVSFRRSWRHPRDTE